MHVILVCLPCPKFSVASVTTLGHQTFGDSVIYALPQATTPFLRRYLLALPEHRGIDLRCEPLHPSRCSFQHPPPPLQLNLWGGADNMLPVSHRQVTLCELTCL